LILSYILLSADNI